MSRGRSLGCSQSQTIARDDDMPSFVKARMRRDDTNGVQARQLELASQAGRECPEGGAQLPARRMNKPKRQTLPAHALSLLGGNTKLSLGESQPLDEANAAGEPHPECWQAAGVTSMSAARAPSACL